MIFFGGMDFFKMSLLPYNILKKIHAGLLKLNSGD
jgi:hypothetical protein